jgi:hypothetical protein
LRRGQVDSTGKTVRNLYTNPGAEAAGATVTVRTNLCVNPNFEGTSGTVNVRTNLCTNPSFEVNTSGWSPNTGSPTIAVDSTHAFVGTKGLKMTSTVSSADIAVLFNAGLLASTTYTLSYWVYSPDARTCYFDVAGTGWTPSGNGTTSVPANTWTKVSATVTSPSASPGNTTFYLHNGGGPTTIGTSLWIDAILLEASPLVGTYFDGSTAAAGDFTYAWSGTANASNSYQQAPGVATWSSRWFGNSGGSGVFYKSSTGGVTGGCARKLFVTAATGSPQDTGINPTTKIAVNPNVSYTFSASVRASVSQNFTPYIIWYDSTNTLINTTPITTYTNAPANTYTRVSVTGTSPSNAASADFIVGPYVSAQAMPAGSYLDFDQVLVEASTILSPYFDGATAAGSDFTYVWSGTANASSSYQQAVGAATTSMQNCFVIQSTDWAANGSKSFRIVPGPTATTDTSCNLPIALQNKTYTLMATCRVKTAQTGTPDSLRARRIQLYYTGIGPSQSLQAPNVPGVYPLSVTFTVTDSTQYNSLRLYNGASAGNGDIWWDNVMLVEGVYTGDFINPGVTPFSKWDGAANASTSVGYSTQLSDFAGKPFYDGSNVAMQTNFVVPDGPLTVYSVQQLNQTTGNPGYWELSDGASWTATSGVARMIGSLSTQGRFDLLTTPTGGTLTNLTVDPMQMQVLAIAMDQLNTGADTQMNGATTVSVAANASFRAASGATMRIGTRDGGSVGTVVTTRFLVYQGKHNLATRQAISRFLGNKYSINVA